MLEGPLNGVDGLGSSYVKDGLEEEYNRLGGASDEFFTRLLSWLVLALE